MRILLLGNPYNRDAGARSFGFAMRFYNGLVRAGHMVYFYADRDEARHQAPLFGSMKKLGVQKANQKFLKAVDNIRPEAIIFAHVGVITPETMQEVRRKYPDIRVAYINVDALFCPKNIQNIERMREYSDTIFLTTGGAILQKYATNSCRLYFMPNITDRSMDTGRAFEIDHPAYDVASFMHGTHNHHNDQAARLSLADQVAQIDNIKVFYRGFGSHPGIYARGYLEALSQSAMTLCLNRHSCDGMMSTPETRYLYCSDRTAHVMGNGSMAIMSTDFGLQDLYKEDEVVFFASDEELIDKVKFYKNNPASRQKIAYAGWEKAHRELNEEVVMQCVIDRLFDQPLNLNYSWQSL